MINPTKKTAIERLRKIVRQIPGLEPLSEESSEFVRWYQNAKSAVGKIFGRDSSNFQDFTEVRYNPTAYSFDNREHAFRESYKQGLKMAEAILMSMLDEVLEDCLDELASPVSDADSFAQPDTNEVFVVHGRDEGSKETVARFLSKLGLQPVVLHEKANQGRTIIEKFEQYAGVGFAVVLLTPDDIGAPQDESAGLQPRARQNVIFELGFFLGKLGRHRT